MISIVVPVYNAEKYLKNCIESILSQSYSDIEVILVDDGSTDHSGSICDQIAIKDNRIKVIHQKNKGVSSARNAGLKECIGDWIMFVDADDELYVDSIEHLLGNVKDDIDLVIGGYRQYSENGDVIYEVNDREILQMNSHAAIKLMYKSLYYNYQGYSSNKLFRRDILMDNQIAFNDNIYYNEDRLFVVNYVIKCSNRIIYDTTPVYKYFVRDSGAMASMNKSFNRKFITDFDAYLLMYESIRSQVRNSELTQLARRGIFMSYSRIKDMMKRYGVKDIKLQLHLLSGLIITNSYRYVVLHKLSKLKSYIYA